MPSEGVILGAAVGGGGAALFLTTGSVWAYRKSKFNNVQGVLNEKGIGKPSLKPGFEPLRQAEDYYTARNAARVGWGVGCVSNCEDKLKYKVLLSQCCEKTPPTVPIESDCCRYKDTVFDDTVYENVKQDLSAPLSSIEQNLASLPYRGQRGQTEMQFLMRLEKNNQDYMEAEMFTLKNPLASGFSEAQLNYLTTWAEQQARVAGALKSAYAKKVVVKGIRVTGGGSEEINKNTARWREQWLNNIKEDVRSVYGSDEFRGLKAAQEALKLPRFPNPPGLYEGGADVTRAETAEVVASAVDAVRDAAAKVGLPDITEFI